MQNRSPLWILFFALIICAGLAIDQFYKPWGQYIVDVGVWIVFATLLKVSDRLTRTRFLICLVLATGGELVLCHLLHFYTYREKNIPLFVPPGHVLLYASGVWLAPRVSKWLWALILGAALVYALFTMYSLSQRASFISLPDELSLILFALWCVLICRKSICPLASVMFLLALGVEIIGTSFGNWVWAPRIFFLSGHLTQNNPPFAVGVFYCALDFLVASLSPLTPSEKTSPPSYDIIKAHNIPTSL
jgi:hypothetical protein